MTDNPITRSSQQFEPKPGHGASPANVWDAFEDPTLGVVSAEAPVGAMTIDIEEMKRLCRRARLSCEPVRPGDSSPDLYLMAPFRLTVAEALIERLEAAEARCAELQSHQDDYNRAHVGIEAAERDADRYRWLREQTWYSADMFVVAGSKSNVRRGTDCPNGDRLDAAIDAARARGKT
jgi:hypothetical protein